MSEGSDFNPSVLGSEQTDALQHARPISWRSEGPLPEKEPGMLATAGNVGSPEGFSMRAAARHGRPGGGGPR